MPHIDSYYAATQTHASDYPTLSNNIDTDICVIGGGLAGLTAAHELAQRGKSVVLLEGEKVGWGASGRNGGFVSDGYAEGVSKLEAKLGFEHAKALYDLSREGTQFVRANIDKFDDPELLVGNGWLDVVRRDNGEALNNHAIDMADRFGANVHYLDRDQIQQRLKSDRYFQGVEDRSAFHIHPLNYVQRLAQEISKLGAQIFEQTKAVELSRHQAGATVTTDGGHMVKAKSIVLCGSAYMRNLFPKVDSAVLPVATYVITSKKMKRQLERAISYDGAISDDRRAGDYYRLVDDGSRLLWGGRITTQRNEPKHLAHMLAKDIEAIYPQLSGIEIEYAWSGLMGYCVHKMPLLREVEPNIWTATATGGHGLNSTAAIGIAVAEAIAGETDRHKLFGPFKAWWGGGPIGRVATQFAYWQMQLQDRWDERSSTPSANH